LLDVLSVRGGELTLDVSCDAPAPIEELMQGLLPPNVQANLRRIPDEPVAGRNGTAPHESPYQTPAHGGNGRTATVAAMSRNGETAEPVAEPGPEGGPDGPPEPQPEAPPEQEQPTAAGEAPARTPEAPASTKLLIALDGSRLAEKALSYVAERFDARVTEIHLMSVVARSEGDAMRRSIEDSPAASYRRLYLRACAQDLQGFRIRCIVGAHDAAAEALLHYAERHGIDLIVMTAHGHGRNARFPLGGVAEGVICQQRIPVLLLPGYPEEEAAPVER
jgi:nucleotide-binding universal stress UspA family protein